MFDERLKVIYKNEIDCGFLFKVLAGIYKKLGPTISLYYSLPTIEKISQEALFNIESDVCKHIVAVHHAYSIFLSAEEILKNEKSEAYTEKVVNSASSQVKLRRYASCYFRNKNLMPGENYIYYPIPYDMFVICISIAILLQNKSNKPDTNYLFLNITNKCMAVLILLESGLYDNCYPICRSMVEVWIKLLAFDSDDTLNRFYEFSEFENEKGNTGRYSQSFYHAFDNRLCMDCTNKVEYINWGWVDSIVDYHKIVKEFPYSINGVIEYLSQKYTFPMVGNFRDWYKKCNRYSHGAIGSVQYDLQNYFEIFNMITPIIWGIYDKVCKNENKKTIVEDIDMSKKVVTDYAVMQNQYKNCNIDNLKKYYTNKK